MKEQKYWLHCEIQTWAMWSFGNGTGVVITRIDRMRGEVWWWAKPCGKLDPQAELKPDWLSGRPAGDAESVGGERLLVGPIGDKGIERVGGLVLGWEDGLEKWNEIREGLLYDERKWREAMTKPKEDGARVRARRGSGASAREHVGTKVSAEDGARLRVWSRLHGLTVSEAVRLAVKRLLRRARVDAEGARAEVRRAKGLKSAAAPKAEAEVEVEAGEAEEEGEGDLREAAGVD